MKKSNKYFLLLILFSLAYAVIFFALKYLQYKSFFSYEWDDEASQIQLAYNAFRGDFLKQTIFIAPICYGRFTPFSLVLGAIFWFFPRPETWFVVTGLAYGFSSIWVFLIGRKLLDDVRLAFLVAVAFLCYAPLHYANLGMVDTKTLALFLLLAMFYFLITRRLVPYLVFFILAVATKQDIALVTLCVGLYAWWKGYPRKFWLTTILFSLVYFVLVTTMMNTVLHTPGVESHPEVRVYSNYDAQTFLGVFQFLVSRPVEFLQFVFSANHLRMLWLILFPVLFLPVLALETYCALPLFIELSLLNGTQNYNSEYIAAIIPFIFIGLICFLSGILRQKRNRLAHVLVWCIIGACLISNFTRNIIGDGPRETAVDQKNFVDHRFQDVRNIFDPRLYVMDEEDRLAWKFINLIPDGASVTATGDLLTPLAARKKLYSFGLNEPEAWESEYGPEDNYPAYESEYILIHTRNLCNGLGGQYAFTDKTLTGKIIREKLLPGGKHSIMAQEGDFVLLRRNL